MVVVRAPRTVPRALWRAVVLALLLLGITAAVAAIGVSDLRARVEAAGPWGPVAFVAAYAIVTLAPLPKNVLSASAGVLFGIEAGVAVVLAGATVGASVGFGLARLLGREAVEQWAGPRIRRGEELLRRHGALGVFVARLVPVVPFTVINYASGLSPIRFRSYLLGTVPGMVPGTVAYVALGAYGMHTTSWEFIAAALGLLTLSAAGVLLARSARRHQASGGDPGATGASALPDAAHRAALPPE